MKLVINENGNRSEIDYGVLSMVEIRCRLRAYEEKYGSYLRYLNAYSCSDSTPDETTVLMDWECLIDEEKSRNGSSV